MDSIEFVCYDLLFLNLSWTWLNDPEIKNLTDTPDFSKEEQLKWFEGLKNKGNYRIWGVKFNSVPIAVVGFKNIQFGVAEYFGYIGEKEYWNKGISRLLFNELINIANEIGLNKLWLKVKKDNLRALRSYLKYGFEHEKETEAYYYMFLIIETEGNNLVNIKKKSGN